MSYESMPVLSSAVAIFEVFMSQWESLRKESPRLTPWIDIGLDWARKYYKFMDDTDAYIVTMCESLILSQHELKADDHFVVLNPCIRFHWILDEWGSKYIKHARSLILHLVSTSW